MFRRKEELLRIKGWTFFGETYMCRRVYSPRTTTKDSFSDKNLWSHFPLHGGESPSLTATAFLGRWVEETNVPDWRSPIPWTKSCVSSKYRP